LRILIYGTSPICGSGYATAVRYVSRGLMDRGHEVGIYAWNSHAGHVLDMNGCPVFPRTSTPTGWDGIGVWVDRMNADILLAIADPWIQGIEQWRSNHSAKVAFWYPCQSHPASPILVDLVNKADAALCYSQWGNDVMRRGGAEKSVYVPLGVDTNVYRPKDKDVSRKFLTDLTGRDLSEKYVVGMVAANSQTVPASRKAFDQTILAFAEFHKRDRPDAVLYLHTWPNRYQGGFDLGPIIEACGLDVGKDVLFPALCVQIPGLDDDGMASVYNAFDVACQATSAEGFGLPILEAQACGIPVIATDGSSMPELVKNGRLVEPACQLWAPFPVEGWVDIPSAKDIATWLRFFASGVWDGRDMGIEFAQGFTWDRVIDDYLLPALGPLSPGG
jgi:glycosyltransferase involved in cell wall biosynthesis